MVEMHVYTEIDLYAYICHIASTQTFLHDMNLFFSTLGCKMCQARPESILPALASDKDLAEE